MRKRLWLTTLLTLGIICSGMSQEVMRDTTLEEIVIQAYTADRAPEKVPASVGFLGRQDLYRYSNTNLLPAMNSLAGVRMEERSPGSYRFSIRGSSLRSPFGVRNVKVYYNGLPFTDAGGNTYLNLIDLSQVGSVEVLRGPAGSLYGAGTGGAILLSQERARRDGLGVDESAGSYGLQRSAVRGTWSSASSQGVGAVAHQRSDGYREQSAMDRTSYHLAAKFPLNSRDILGATVFYNDLYYQTPGGLNKTQFLEDPSQARPPTATIPGAVEQQAAVNNKTIYAGISLDNLWNENWNTVTGVFGSFSDFENPTIRNYEEREEPNLGVRTVTKYTTTVRRMKNIISAGGEFQVMDASIDIFGNEGGVKTDVLSKDKIRSSLGLLFAQNDLSVNDRFNITVGLSLNFSKVDFERRMPDVIESERSFDPVLLPRVAILQQFTDNLSVYASFSQGFSPPTMAELFPSREVFDMALQEEHGDNYEIGLKGTALSKSFSYELTAYNFQLEETIVIRRDASLPGEPEYFVNAGETSQRGLEAQAAYNIVANATGLVSDFRVSGSFTYNHYRFKDYVQNSEDYSGNMLTGVPPSVVFGAVDLRLKRRFYMNVSGNYVDHIPLNDANTEFASPFFLLGLRAGYVLPVKEHRAEVYAGMDNAMDETYSLGYDLNAIGGRYYNAAAPRNFYAGVKFDLSL